MDATRRHEHGCGNGVYIIFGEWEQGSEIASEHHPNAFASGMDVDRPALQSAPGLVDAEAYQVHVESVGPGTFGGEGYGGSFG